MAANSFPKTLETAPHLDQLAKEVAEALGCKEQLTRIFIRATFVAIRVFDYKQSNYGPGNIAKFGYPGVVVRASDKFERLANLLKKQLYGQGGEPVDETIEDTLGDQANYGLIALMCRWGVWPGVPAAVRPATGGMVKPGVVALVGEGGCVGHIRTLASEAAALAERTVLEAADKAEASER